MIFVTVGTHEDSFDRLVKEVDSLKCQNSFPDEVFIQLGYSMYRPSHCQFENLIGYQLMDEYIRMARVVITHGGPSSIMHALRYGKTPIVVPRQKQFKEHVDDHQVLFCEKFQNTGSIIPVFDIGTLGEKIKDYDILVKQIGDIQKTCSHDNLTQFTRSLEEITHQLMFKKS